MGDLKYAFLHQCVTPDHVRPHCFIPPVLLWASRKDTKALSQEWHTFVVVSLGHKEHMTRAGTIQKTGHQLQIVGIQEPLRDRCVDLFSRRISLLAGFKKVQEPRCNITMACIHCVALRAPLHRRVRRWSVPTATSAGCCAKQREATTALA